MLMTFFSLHTILYLSLSLFLFLLNHFFPLMMSFCRKSVHSLLGLTAATMESTTADHHHHHNNLNPPWKCQALGLVTATSDYIRRRYSPNVLESSAIIKSSSPSLSSPPTTKKKDPGWIGFIDDIGGGVDGLMSCTESLGFESSDERRFDDENEELASLVSHDHFRPLTKGVKWKNKMSMRRSTEVKKFPPPISSLNRNGQPSFFLRPVRKDGRLELMEVRINRPEILRAYRGDGRLRLHFIRDDDDGDEDDDDHQDYINAEEKEEEKEEDTEEEEKVEEEERNVNGDEWQIPMNSTAGEGFRRCHEVAKHHEHHHHNHLHVWRQHCVTTR